MYKELDKIRKNVISKCKDLKINNYFEVIKLNENEDILCYEIQVDTKTDPDNMSLGNYHKLEEYINGLYMDYSVNFSILYWKNDEKSRYDGEACDNSLGIDNFVELDLAEGFDYEIVLKNYYDKNGKMYSKDIDFYNVSYNIDPPLKSKQKLRILLDKIEKHYGIKIDYKVEDNVDIKDIVNEIKKLKSPEYYSKFYSSSEHSFKDSKQIYINYPDNELIVYIKGYNVYKHYVIKDGFENFDANISCVVEENLNKFIYDCEYSGPEKQKLNEIGSLNIRSILNEYLRDLIAWENTNYNCSLNLEILVSDKYISKVIENNGNYYFLDEDDSVITYMDTDFLEDTESFKDKINELLRMVNE